MSLIFAALNLANVFSAAVPLMCVFDLFSNIFFGVFLCKGYLVVLAKICQRGRLLFLRNDDWHTFW